MALQADDIVDLITTTLRNLGENKWTDLTYDLQEHVAYSQLRNQMKAGYESGYGLQFNVVKGTSNNAKMTGLFDVDDLNATDQAITGNVPWRWMKTGYNFDKREVKMNMTPRRIVDMVKQRRAGAMTDFAALFETQFWSKPADSTDNLNIFGLPYWVVQANTEGFNGGNPTGFTAGCAGISSSTYPRWANWTAQYVDVTKTDLIRKWRNAATKTVFKPPVMGNPDYNTGNKYGYYVPYSVLGLLEESLEGQNENLGNDIASKDGQVTFRRTPVQWVPFLDNDATNPIYGINWGVLKFSFLNGMFQTETPPMITPGAHNVIQVWQDSGGNLECFDRRRLFVLHV